MHLDRPERLEDGRTVALLPSRKGAHERKQQLAIHIPLMHPRGELPLDEEQVAQVPATCRYLRLLEVGTQQHSSRNVLLLAMQDALDDDLVRLGKASPRSEQPRLGHLGLKVHVDVPVMRGSLERALHQNRGPLFLVALEQHARQQRADGTVKGEIGRACLQKLLATLAGFVELAEAMLHLGKVERVEQQLVHRGVHTCACLGLQVYLLGLRHVTYTLVCFAERLVDHAHKRGFDLVPAVQQLVALRESLLTVALHGNALHFEALRRELHDARIEATRMRWLLHATLEAGDPALRVGDARIRDARPCREHAKKRRGGELGRGYAAEPQKVVGPLVRAGKRAGSLGQVRHIVEVARQQQVLRCLVLHPVIVEPLARPRAPLPDLLDPQLQKLGAQPVGEQRVETEPRALLVAGHDEEVAPYQFVEKDLRRTGTEDRLAKGAAERLEHRYLQHEREQVPGHQARDLRLEVAPHVQERTIQPHAVRAPRARQRSRRQHESLGPPFDAAVRLRKCLVGWGLVADGIRQLPRLVEGQGQILRSKAAESQAVGVGLQGPRERGRGEHHMESGRRQGAEAQHLGIEAAPVRTAVLVDHQIAGNTGGQCLEQRVADSHEDIAVKFRTVLELLAYRR